MTRILPILPTDLTKASTYDLLSYLNTKLAEIAEESYEIDGEVRHCGEWNEKISEITTELLKRHDNRMPAYIERKNGRGS